VSGRLCMVSRIPGVAGPAGFQRRLASALQARGVGVVYGLKSRPYDLVLVIGATRDLAPLWRARRRGIPIVQRLDGMNWIHRVTPTGVRHWLRAEINNWMLRLVRDRIASAVVYQSQFAKGWWEERYGTAPCQAAVVYNGVPLDQYSPRGEGRPPRDLERLLVVEGGFAGGYEVGLRSAVALAQRLGQLRQVPVELAVAGKVPEGMRARWREAKVRWLGLLPAGEIPRLDRSAHLLYAADVNAACPNAVIEAMACGLPVVAFATGALPELVTEEAGRVVPYGGDPWRLDPPDLEALAQAAVEVLGNQDRFRRGARRRAEQAFGLERMVQGYLEVFGRLAPVFQAALKAAAGRGTHG